MSIKAFLSFGITILNLISVSFTETITPCEVNDQYLADADSCTKFHRCRALQGEEGPPTKFTTDIAICSLGTVFDLVSTRCVDIGEGLLQDPDSCVKYYGCDVSRETTEGYVRSRFFCPGQLRFHPGVRRCVYRTRVHDALCNSLQPNQMVIRTDIGAQEETFNPLQSLIRPFVASPVHNLTPLNLLRSNALRPNDQRNPARPSSGNRPLLVKANPNQGQRTTDEGKETLPKPENKIDEIAQVISGQLFSLSQSKPKQENKKGNKISGKSEVKSKAKKQ